MANVAVHLDSAMDAAQDLMDGLSALQGSGSERFFGLVQRLKAPPATPSSPGQALAPTEMSQDQPSEGTELEALCVRGKECLRGVQQMMSSIGMTH